MIFSRFRFHVLAALLVLQGVLPTSSAQAEEDAKNDAFIWYVGIDMTDAETQKQWFVSDFTIQKPSFRTAWDRENTRIREGELELLLRPSKGVREKDFVGAEIQRKLRTHHGRYEVVMTAARGEGVISSFFTFTGPYFEDPHDEIDFEFLGRDTTKVWVNLFSDGKKLPGQWVDLGFDAAEEPHLYAFEWSPDEVVWYVDGRELLRAPARKKALPNTPGRVYINIWAGGKKQEKWSGTAPEDTFAIARYQCLSYQPMGAASEQCSDRFPVE